MTDPRSLELPYPGFVITADHYRGVTEAARSRNYPTQGNTDSAGTIYYPPPKYTNRIQITPIFDVPRWTTFTLVGVTGGATKTGPSSTNPRTTFKGKYLATNPSITTSSLTANCFSYGYFCNQDGDLYANKPGYVTQLVPGVPTLVGLSTANPPKEGFICGMALGGASFISDGPYRDLICLSANTTTKLCDIVWVPWLVLEGEAVSQINPATNSRTGPSFGDVALYADDTTDTHTPLQRVLTAITVPVTSYDTSLLVPAGKRVDVVFRKNLWRMPYTDC